jgi:hypothetical protein
VVTVSYSDHIQAVVDHLNDAGLNVGRGAKPAGSGWQGAPGQSAFVPYGIVWRIGAKDALDLSMDDDRLTMANLLIFVRCFGGTVGEVETHLDAVHAQMLDGLTVPERAVVRVYLDNGQTTTRSESTEVALFEAGNFYRLWTVPAPTVVIEPED